MLKQRKEAWGFENFPLSIVTFWVNGVGGFGGKRCSLEIHYQPEIRDGRRGLGF